MSATNSDEVTAVRDRIPGCVFVVVNKDGKTIFEHASGKRGADTEEAMTLDSTTWIASCTKRHETKPQVPAQLLFSFQEPPYAQIQSFFSQCVFIVSQLPSVQRSLASTVEFPQVVLCGLDERNEVEIYIRLGGWRCRIASRSSGSMCLSDTGGGFEELGAGRGVQREG
ncbi:MAG: hypothetical protein LQ345_006405 [Seirophora villosa]|nr:MAG: hypothetical protein LQ345_006405 [Seirophora villosa]